VAHPSRRGRHTCGRRGGRPALCGAGRAHSIIPAAAVFNAAGEKWTLSFFEAVNFGAFVGDPTKTKLILERIINEAKRLKVKEVCICECGTAYR